MTETKLSPDQIVTGKWHPILLQRMNDLNLSYQKIADATGICKSSVGNYMRGEISPTVENFYKICNFLKLEL